MNDADRTKRLVQRFRKLRETMPQSGNPAVGGNEPQRLRDLVLAVHRLELAVDGGPPPFDPRNVLNALEALGSSEDDPSGLLEEAVWQISAELGRLDEGHAPR